MSLAQAQKSLTYVSEYRGQVAGSVRTARDVFASSKAAVSAVPPSELHVSKLELPSKPQLPSEGVKKITSAIGDGHETIKGLATSAKAVEQAVRDVLGRVEAQNAVHRQFSAMREAQVGLATSVTEFFASADALLSTGEIAVAGNLESFVKGLPAFLDSHASFGVREANVMLATQKAQDIVGAAIGDGTHTSRSILLSFKSYVNGLESALAEADVSLAAFKSAFPGMGGAVGSGTLSATLSLSDLRKNILAPANVYVSSVLGFLDGISTVLNALTNPVTAVVAALKNVQKVIDTETVVESKSIVTPIDDGDPAFVELEISDAPAPAVARKDDDVIEIKGFFASSPASPILVVGTTRFGVANVEAVEEPEAQSVSGPVADVAAPAFDLDGAMDSLTVCINTSDASGAREIIARVRENVNGAPEHMDLLEALKGIESELPA